MSLRLCSGLLLLSILSASVGCGPSGPEVNSYLIEREMAETLLGPTDGYLAIVRNSPDLPPARPVAPGAVRANLTLDMPNGDRMDMWVYQPDPLPAGKIPCVFMAPKGTIMVHGKDLSPADQAEHEPWVLAGFAVIGFELSGDADDDSPAVIKKDAARRFRDAKSGLMNLQVAMAYAQEKLDYVDPRHFYTVGHGSAGTFALYAAQMDPRVRGTVALMPAVDLRNWFGTQGMTYLQQNEILNDAGRYIQGISPSNYVERLTRPTFLFYAQDDQEVSSQDIQQFGAKLRELGRDVTVAGVPTGGHVEAMTNQGQPLAIEWLKMISGHSS